MTRPGFPYGCVLGMLLALAVVPAYRALAAPPAQNAAFLRFPTADVERFGVYAFAFLLFNYFLLRLLLWVLVPPRATPSPARRVAAGLLTGLGLLIALEACLHVYDGMQPTLAMPDPVTLWTLRPNARIREVPDPEIAVNALGIRGPSVALAKPPSGLRVVVVGDSALYGDHVDYPETMAARLQDALARALPGRVVEVIDLAVPAWTSFQGLYRLETLGLALQPDLVIVGFNNGPEPAMVSDAQRSLLRSPLLPLYRALYHSYVYLILRTSLIRDQASVQGWSPGAATRRVTESEHMANLGRMKALCQARHIPILFLIMPRNTAEAGRWPSYMDLAGLAGPGSPVLDVNRLWHADGDNRHLFRAADAVHPNVEGHHRLAAEVMDEIVRRRLLPVAEGQGSARLPTSSLRGIPPLTVPDGTQGQTGGPQS